MSEICLLHFWRNDLKCYTNQTNETFIIIITFDPGSAKTKWLFGAWCIIIIIIIIILLVLL